MWEFIFWIWITIPLSDDGSVSDWTLRIRGSIFYPTENECYLEGRHKAIAGFKNYTITRIDGGCFPAESTDVEA